MYLGIDYGKKRIGIAIGQELPRGKGYIEQKEPDAVVREIEKVCKDNEIIGIVIGLPVYPSGQESDLTKEVKKFGSLLNERLNLPVYYEVEELTSLEAGEILKKQGINFPKTGQVDEMAAVLILEQFLSHKKREALNWE